MASVPAIVFLLAILIISITTIITVKAERNHSDVIKLGSSLYPNSNLSSWLSPSGRFAFGFYPQGNRFAVGIWLVDHTHQSIVVWTARRDDPPVSSSAVLRLTRDQGLLLRTEQGAEVPITELSKSASSADMLDSGNFVVYGHHSEVIWQSFDSPTDTILGGQDLSSGNGLVSSVSVSDHSSGRFVLTMQSDGNLVSYPLNSSFSPDFSYWSSNTYGNIMSLSLNLSGFLVLLPDTGTGSARPLATGRYDTQINGTIFHRATLDADGIFRLYLHNYSERSSSSKVLIVWSSLHDQCEVKGFCGLNSYCSPMSGKENEGQCYCYPGFVINPSDAFQGCYQNSSDDGCTGNEDPPLQYKVASIDNMLWPCDPYSVLPLQKLQVCSDSCLKDCNCKAALYLNGSCNKYKLPLRFGRTSPTISTTGFIKVAAIHDHPRTTSTRNSTVIKYETKNSHGLIIILTASLGSIACMCFVFAVSSFIIYMHRLQRYKKLLEYTKVGLADEFTLQSFSYTELEEATHGFKDELGRGTFGAVYKGTLSTSNKIVAVKRLEKVVEEGVREFKAEITTIGRTHHKNLVQLLGFCVEGSRKLLVYEYMSNGSLADLLFKAASVRPSWRERVGIVLDVAKGVLYLHEECGVHIIHCNLKPQNILLDHTWTAKISDFGLARLLVPNESEVAAGVERRRGYLAPEWQKNALISVKSDIYSFGIVLLETVSGRKNIELKVSAQDEIILSSWAYKCFTAGELYKLVKGDQNVDLKTLERMVTVGLWCVQDDPALRPPMKNVILMLEGTMNIPLPPSTELPPTC